MSIVNLQDVRLSRAADVANPALQVSILSYANRQYTLVQVFANDRLEPAQGLWRYLHEQGKVCLILQGDNQYSVWVEQIDRSPQPSPLDPELETILRMQLRSINLLWTEARGLLGTSQALSFGREILASFPKVKSLQDLTTAISLAIQSTASLEQYALTSPQLFQLYSEIERLGIEYLGKSYTKELLDDLHQGLSLQLQQELQTWLERQSKRSR
jgi:hypothetical protein